MELLRNNFRMWWQYPRKVEDRSEHRSVAFLELFYDLVYVVFIAQLAHSLAGHVAWQGFADLFISVCDRLAVMAQWDVLSRCAWQQ